MRRNGGLRCKGRRGLTRCPLGKTAPWRGQGGFCLVDNSANFRGEDGCRTFPFTARLVGANTCWPEGLLVELHKLPLAEPAASSKYSLRRDI